MKKELCLLLCVTILLISGCKQRQTRITEDVVFYYMQNNQYYGSTTGVVASTVVEIPKEEFNYKNVLDVYIKGPTNYDCISPFPAGTTIEILEINRDKALLVLSPHFTTISNSSLTVALACLSRTVIELTGVKIVQIQIVDNLICGKRSITLTKDNFIYYDSVQPDNIN